MLYPQNMVNGVPGEKPSSDIGVFIKRGGVVVSDDQDNRDSLLYDAAGAAQFFKFLHVGGTGNIVYRTAEKQPDVLFNVPAGAIIPLHGDMVLSSATINSYDDSGAIVSSEIVSTTATFITWHGGE